MKVASQILHVGLKEKINEDLVLNTSQKFHFNFRNQEINTLIIT